MLPNPANIGSLATPPVRPRERPEHIIGEWTHTFGALEQSLFIGTKKVARLFKEELDEDTYWVGEILVEGYERTVDNEYTSNVPCKRDVLDLIAEIPLGKMLKSSDQIVNKHIPKQQK